METCTKTQATPSEASAANEFLCRGTGWESVVPGIACVDHLQEADEHFWPWVYLLCHAPIPAGAVLQAPKRLGQVALQYCSTIQFVTVVRPVPGGADTQAERLELSALLR